jgi:hypothetical protein
MRKLFLMLAVLLVASAAYAADVTISCTADGNVVTVSYEASAEANIPRAFSLDIQLSTDATITDVTPLDPNYWVYPGSYDEDPCTPVGDPCDSEDTLPGEDSNGVTIEMASLHSPTGSVANPNAPDISNALLSFKVSGDCNVYISSNAARGKVVFYDATNEDDGRDVVYTGCTVESGCLKVGETVGGVYITQAMRDLWDSLGQPDCWCYDCHWKGDTDGDCDVDYYDVTDAVDGWNDYNVTNPDGLCADVDNDGDVDYYDVTDVRDGWDNGCGDCDPLP